MENREAKYFINSETQVRKKVVKNILSGKFINYNKYTKQYTVKYSYGQYNKMIHI